MLFDASLTPQPDNIRYCNTGFSTLGNSLSKTEVPFNYPLYLIMVFLFILVLAELSRTRTEVIVVDSRKSNMKAPQRKITNTLCRDSANTHFPTREGTEPQGELCQTDQFIFYLSGNNPETNLINGSSVSKVCFLYLFLLRFYRCFSTIIFVLRSSVSTFITK